MTERFVTRGFVGRHGESGESVIAGNHVARELLVAGRRAEIDDDRIRMQLGALGLGW